jgi:glutamine synthetase adenylyltransferase
VSAKQLEEYFSGEAQAWEALMYTKLRFIVGSHTVAERALGATQDLFGRYSANTQFLTSVLDMRSKLERAEEDGPNLKNSPGGIYDIDFIVAYLLVRYGARKTGGNLRERIWRCMDLKILDKALADILDHAAELFRTTEHVVRLVTGRAHKWLPSTQRARELSERLIHQSLGREFPNGVETELRTTMERVRSTYLKIMA